MLDLCVIIPVYNEGDELFNSVELIYQHLIKLNCKFRIILVNDGSVDNSWVVIEKLAANHEEIHGICFSRNFGKESAVFAGLNEAISNCVIVMDADLQHPPSLIKTLYDCWLDGYKVVEAVKTKRNDSVVSRIRAKVFNKVLKKLTGINIENSSDFKLIDRQVVLNLLRMAEVNTFFRAMVTWAGFPTKQIQFEVDDRVGGKSKFTLLVLIKMAIHGVVSFSSIPLHIVSIFGVIFLILSTVLGIQTLYVYFSGTAVTGFTTVILIQLFAGSLILLGLGVIGLYLSKIYVEVKKRPTYIILKKTQHGD